MSFRRDGNKAHTESRTWSAWLDEHAEQFAIADLPPDVMASEAKFAYFIDRTYNQDGWLGDAPWHSLDLMTGEQRRALWHLIQAAYSSLWEHPHEFSAANLERTYGPSTWDQEVST